MIMDRASTFRPEDIALAKEWAVSEEKTDMLMNMR